MKVRPAYYLMLFLLVLTGLELWQTWLPLPFERSTRVMGTTVRVKVTGPGSPHWTRRALYELQRLDRLFNRFDEKSEISLLNRLAGKAPLQLSADTAAVLKMAQEVRRASHGAFNVRLKDSSIDLGGIGKGYAVESARRLLLKKGVKSAIIDMHSSIAVIGGPWRIGILDPSSQSAVSSSQKTLKVVTLNNGEALSTSGQYQQPGHIVDPRTGKPADQCLSVTVVADDAALADALSTALFVLGPRDGISLLRHYKVKAFIVDRNGKIYDYLSTKLR
jgi:thiamine biosynthesis lipoprotein